MPLVGFQQIPWFDDTDVIRRAQLAQTGHSIAATAKTRDFSSALPFGWSRSPRIGRDHNPYGFTMWLAGGGVKGGYVHGATDEFGYQAVEKPVHVLKKLPFAFLLE